MRPRSAGLLLALAGLLLTAAAVPAQAAPPAHHPGHPGHPGTPGTPTAGFVTRHGDDLKLDGRKFRFAGSNNYYLMYKSPTMVDDVFADAKAAGFTVLRTWGFLDIGNADGSDSVAGPADGVYFQYFDGERPAYNDGPDGLQRLDYVLAAAREAGIKLVVPLTNNWRDFGGMDQYVRWRGGQYHDDFYTDPVIRGWYKDWISHVLNRTNTITGVRYKDDPTVMTWELGNEPRCKGSGVYPQSPDCATDTLTAWADEMTRHVKSIAPRQLVSVGDEGFFCDDPTSADWTINCGEGVDSVALSRLPAVDVVSYHLYPDHWGKDAAWGAEWITRHAHEAKKVRKPVMLGEFGIHDKSTRNVVYREWTDAAIAGGTSGFLYWILSGVQDDGSLYPDYDGYTVYCPSPVCTTLSNAGAAVRGDRRPWPPVADHDTTTVEFGQVATLRPAANDIAHRGTVRAATIDLDPTVPGQQKQVTVAGGEFSLGGDGAVTFTPADGFAGRATAHYQVWDRAWRASNVAELVVTVKPDPAGVQTLFSFEAGTDGWGPPSWEPGVGSVAQSDAFATDGAYGLRVDSVTGGWFGTSFPEPVDLSGRVTLKYDLRTDPSVGTNAAIAVQTGPSYTWCQSTFTWLNQDWTGTAEIDLLTEMSCDAEALADVREFYVYVNPGTVHIDNVRVE
ncbi:cellulase family glycosylhydrolase [Solwaraspora sp. WMMD937]|uniref:cellulase family glycosylhydrolase n=1 Tax=Solwaraspora sp. WMMD937 TaxID=3016090 RepID=UPI00249C1264|nr:cellulase family glycosylhydrolase [Solwaraspora sp. WMMD937]WFE24327.1 cellulase family glycosylhydrolase [Solwaraspora sp. WMMD937]